MSDHDTDTTVLDAEPADDFFDEEWMAGAPRRSRWRLALLVALSAAVVFLGGVEVQKHYGTSTSETAAAGGLPAGGIPEGFPALSGGSAADSSADASGGGQGDGDDTTTSVIGTLTKVDGNTWIVTDLGGTKHTVTVDEDTVLVEEKPLAAGDVPAGSTITVSGAAGDSDDLTATTVTVR